MISQHIVLLWGFFFISIWYQEWIQMPLKYNVIPFTPKEWKVWIKGEEFFDQRASCVVTFVKTDAAYATSISMSKLPFKNYFCRFAKSWFSLFSALFQDYFSMFLRVALKIYQVYPCFCLFLKYKLLCTAEIQGY